MIENGEVLLKINPFQTRVEDNLIMEAEVTVNKTIMVRTIIINKETNLKVNLKR